MREVYISQNECVDDENIPPNVFDCAVAAQNKNDDVITHTSTSLMGVGEN